MADQYEFLTKDNISKYLSSKKVFANLIDAHSLVEFKEVGDGNLNLVFIMKDAAGKGIVLKRALPYVRLVGPDWPMTPSRARIEAETTIIHSKCAPNLVPEIYDYDPDRFIIAMEDLSDHAVWRGALNAGLRFDGVAGPLGKFVANTAFGTSIFSLGQEMHKLEIARAINPGLCLITEDLVFTEPYFENGRNSVLPTNEKDAQELANDKEMVHEIGLLKYKFMTAGESLIHGDLHTGSVMIKCEDKKVAVSVKAIDSEFSFYGPIGFDLGALVANYPIAAARAARRSPAPPQGADQATLCPMQVAVRRKSARKSKMSMLCSRFATARRNPSGENLMSVISSDRCVFLRIQRGTCGGCGASHTVNTPARCPTAYRLSSGEIAIAVDLSPTLTDCSS
jgi:5-methylthioribose kinase